MAVLKKEFTDRMAEIGGITKKDAKRGLELFIETLMDYMSENENKSINNELLNIFIDMVTETAKLHNNLEMVINSKLSTDTDIKQELDTLNKYINYISSILYKLENTNLNANEKTILAKIKEEFVKLERIQSIYMLLESVNNITNGNEKKQENIEKILDVLFVILDIDDEKEDYQDEKYSDEKDLFESIEVNDAASKIVISIPQGQIIIKGDIENIKIVMQEGK